MAQLAVLKGLKIPIFWFAVSFATEAKKNTEEIEILHKAGATWVSLFLDDDDDDDDDGDDDSGDWVCPLASLQISGEVSTNFP